MRAKAIFLRRSRSADIDAAGQQRSLPRQRSALLQLAQLPPQPQLVASAVVEKDHIGRAEVFLVLEPRLRFIVVEDRKDNFESFAEEMIFERLRRRNVQ